MPTVEPGEWRCVSCGRAYSDRAAGDLCPHDERVLVPAATAERFGGDALLGHSLAGNYLIFDILGLGGFGAVYRAIDIAEDRRQVAIKTIRPGAERHNADARARFTQEARLLEKLRDPNIVQVFHYGEADDALFMALELVPGRSLKRILRARQRLSPRRAVHITAQILSALEHAHAFGLVHRDLKPANILVVEHRDDTVKVIDFGIAKVLEVDDEDEGPKTGTGLVLGTVRYMAPEQLRQGGQIGPATDCYAVGIMFYEMLAGKAPFDGSQAEIAAAHLYQPAPALEPSMAPPALRAWVERVLLKDPEARYADAADMRRALLATLPETDAEADPDSVGPDPVEPAPDDRPSGSMDGLSGPAQGPAPSLSEPRSAMPAAPLPVQLPTGGEPDPPPTVETALADAGRGAPEDDPLIDSPASTLPDGAMVVQPEGSAPDTPPMLTVHPPADPPAAPPLDSDLHALPDLSPGSGWGDIDLGHAPTVLRETSGTIQAARGELGLVEPAADDGNRRWWFAGAGLVAVAVTVLLIAPWSTDAPPVDPDAVETIRLSVGQPPPPPPEPVIALPPDAAVPDAAAPDAAPAKAEPRRRGYTRRQLDRLDRPIRDALSSCRCSRARGLLGDLPRGFPRDRRRKLERRLEQCKVPLVDQRCVDGEVR